MSKSSSVEAAERPVSKSFFVQVDGFYLDAASDADVLSEFMQALIEDGSLLYVREAAPGSSNGRTAGSGPANQGSSPCPGSDTGDSEASPPPPDVPQSARPGEERQ